MGQQALSYHSHSLSVHCISSGWNMVRNILEVIQNASSEKHEYGQTDSDKPVRSLGKLWNNTWNQSHLLNTVAYIILGFFCQNYLNRNLRKEN